MKIKILFCVSFMTAVFAACSQMDENEAGWQGEKSIATGNSDVEVRLSSGGLSTRASIESKEDSFEVDNIGIYMLATDRIGNNQNIPSVSWGDDTLCVKMNNVKTSAVKNSSTGGTDLVWADPTAIYWYPYESWYAFCFYGYYPRVENSDITLDRERVLANYTDLDGTKDIIWGQSMRATNDILGKYRYSAQYFRQPNCANAYPNVGFAHKLMRIQFYIQGVEDKNPDIGFDRANKMQLESVQVFARNNTMEPGVWNGVPTTASLVIADLKNPGNEGKININWNGPLAPITMKDENDASYKNKKRVYNDSLIKVGQPLLLPVPDEGAGAGFLYGAQVKLKMLEGNVEIPDAPILGLNLNSTTASLLPGHTYRVVISISGPQKVTLNATLTPWEEISGEGFDNFEF